MQSRFFRYGAPAIAAAFTIAFTVTTISGPARAQTTLDHFKCYLVQKHETITERVKLRDQFDDALGRVEEANVTDPIRFCNPADKRFNGQITPIIDINNHLTFYQYERPDTIPAMSGIVVVSNQFGEQQGMRFRSADILAVPTWKQEAGIEPPGNLDHFKCYFASARDIQDLVVGLRDQFVATRHKLGKALLFCNPVEKTNAAGEVFAIKNPDEHLLCYRISTAVSVSRSLVISNQFTFPTTDIVVGRDNLVCLPSKKLFFSVD